MVQNFNLRLTCPCCGNTERMFVASPPMRYLCLPQFGEPYVSANGDDADLASTSAVCPSCSMPFGVQIKKGNRATLFGLFCQTDRDKIDEALAGSRITTVPASPMAYGVDPDLPEKVREQFVFLQEDAAARRNPAGILALSRACLDVSLKALGESSGGRKQRIESLAKRGIVTKDISDWAQMLWKDGSDAVHDLDADLEVALEHVEFLKLFFEVVFKLPERVTRASHGKVPQPAKSTEQSNNSGAD